MSSDIIRCPHCSAGLRLASAAGKKVRCPKCSEIFVAGAAAASQAVTARAPSPGPRASASPPPLRPSRSDPGDEEDDRPRRKPREEEDYDEDGDERPRRKSRRDDDDRPRRKKKKNATGTNKGLIIGLSLGGVGLVVGGLVLFLVMNSGGSSAPRPGPGPRPVVPGPNPGGGGGDFTSAPGKFRVAFPRNPQQKSQMAAGIMMNMALVEERNGLYMVGYADMPIPAGEPPNAIRQRLIGSQNGALANMGGRATSQKDITLQGKYPGREFSGTMSKGPPGSRIRARIYLVGTRLYQVFVLGNGGISDSPEASRFLDSFTYLE